MFKIKTNASNTHKKKTSLQLKQLIETKHNKIINVRNKLNIKFAKCYNSVWIPFSDLKLRE